MAHNFISYKREQRSFAESIAPPLNARGHAVWVDVQGLLPAEPWGPGVRNAIIACQAFIILLEEGWLKSRPCRDELECAVEHGKKIIVVVAPTHDERSFKASVEQNPALAPLLPVEVSRRNFIWSFSQSVESVVEQISTALQLDFEWNARSSWIQQCAVAWNASARRHGYLHGNELLQVLQEVDRARDLLPKPTSLALEFLRASQLEQRNEVLLTEAEYEWREGNLANALERSRESWRLTKDAGSQPGARHILMAYRLLELDAGAHRFQGSIDTAAMADNGAWIALARGDDICLWKSATIKHSTRPSSGCSWPGVADLHLSCSHRVGGVTCMKFDPQAVLIAAATGSAIYVWSLETGYNIHQLRSGIGAVSELEFSADGNWLLAVGERYTGVWDLGRRPSRPPHKFAAGRSLMIRGPWLIEVTKTPQCAVAIAALDSGREIDFRISHTVARPAEHVVLSEDGEEWGAVCGSQVYRCQPHHKDPGPKLLCDFREPIRVEDPLAPFDHLVLGERYFAVRAVGYAAASLTAVLERHSMSAFVVSVGWNASACDYVETGSWVSAAAVDGDSWTIVLADGATWSGSPGRWQLEPAGRPIARRATLLGAGDTRLCATSDDNNFFWREAKLFRRRSQISSPRRQISRDGKLVLEHGLDGAALWDVSALGTRVPRVLADTGFLVTAIGAHADGKTLVAASGDTLLCWKDQEHDSPEIRNAHLVQGMGVAAQEKRWMALDANGRLLTWRVGHESDRVVELGYPANPPVSVAIAPHGEWGAFATARRQAEFIDLREGGGTRVTLDSGRATPQDETTLAVNPDGRWLFVDSAIWKIVDGLPSLRSHLDVHAKCLAARFVSSGELITVHDDAVVRRWAMADSPGPTAIESFRARVDVNAGICHACLSASAGWLAFTEAKDPEVQNAFVMPTDGAHVAAAINIPRAHQAVLLAVDDSGSWVIGQGVDDMWLYPSVPIGSPVAPIQLASTHAIFVAGGKSVLTGSHDGIIKSWPLDTSDIESELNLRISEQAKRR